MGLSNSVNNWLGKAEPYYFFALVLLNLVPVLAYDFFPTVDGPSHLYNAKLIAELWTDSSGAISQYVKFNTQLTPNWTGHFLLSVLLLFTSPSWAEKLILITFLAGVPLGIRYLYYVADIRNKLLIYLVFPFTYSFLFHYGFYNFNIGIVLFFFGLGLWIKSMQDVSTLRLVALSIICALISLSHPFVFLLFLVLVFVITMKKGVQTKGLAKQSLVLVPGLVITFLFLLTDDSLRSNTTTLPWKDLFISLKYFMPIKGIEATAYDLVSRLMLYLFSVLTLVSVIRFVSDYAKRKSWIWNAGRWLSASVAVLILLLFVPDYFGTAGLISARLMWFFFIMLILWFASSTLPKWLVLVSFLMANGVAFWSIQHNYQSILKSAEIASELDKASEVIEPYSTVLPITYRKSKPFVHVSNYIGVRKPVVLLHNYEAALSYFPLAWNYEKISPQRLGTMETSGCISWIAGVKGTEAEQIDYICVVKEENTSALSCETELKLNLAEYYNIVYENQYGTVVIYKSKSIS